MKFCKECEFCRENERSYQENKEEYLCLNPILFKKIKIPATPIEREYEENLYLSYCIENNIRNNCLYFFPIIAKSINKKVLKKELKTKYPNYYANKYPFSL